MEESFVIHYSKVGIDDYEIIDWYRITEDEEPQKGNSYSEILEVGLDKLLNDE